MRLWRRWRKDKGRAMSDRQGLAKVLRECAGQWVAVDRETNELRATAESPYALAAELRDKGLRNVAIVRAPDPQEPELVGLG